MLIAGIILMIKNPGSFAKTAQCKRKRRRTERVILLGGLMFISGFVVAGLDYRYQWLVLPKWLVITATVIFLFAYLLYGEVLRKTHIYPEQ